MAKGQTWTAATVHPLVAKAAAEAETKLPKLWTKLTAKLGTKAVPFKGTAKAVAAKASNAVLALFKSMFLPMITPIVGGLIVKYGGPKMQPYLEPLRDVLLAAYPVEE